MWGNTKKCTKSYSNLEVGINITLQCISGTCQNVLKIVFRISHTFLKEGDLYGHTSY